jgi:hypothetical protein
MVEVAQRRMLPPHPVVGLVHDGADREQVDDLDREEEQRDRLQQAEVLDALQRRGTVGDGSHGLGRSFGIRHFRGRGSQF